MRVLTALGGQPGPDPPRRVCPFCSLQYENGGRQQLVQCMQELTAAGQVPGIEMAAAGAAVWRKKVLLSWSANWEEYVAQCGIK